MKFGGKKTILIKFNFDYDFWASNVAMCSGNAEDYHYSKEFNGIFLCLSLVKKCLEIWNSFWANLFVFLLWFIE